MANTFIYALCEPGTRTVRYVGKANDPKRRFRDHFSSSTKRRSRLGCWIRSLRGEKPNLVVLREIPEEEWQVAEERYIRLARGLSMDLVNSTDGGDGCHNPSAETRGRMSAARKRRVTAPETRALMSAAHRGVLKTPEHKANIRASRIRWWAHIKAAKTSLI